jgi:hypothetical protein
LLQDLLNETFGALIPRLQIFDFLVGDYQKICGINEEADLAEYPSDHKQSRQPVGWMSPAPIRAKIPSSPRTIATLILKLIFTG